MRTWIRVKRNMFNGLCSNRDWLKESTIDSSRYHIVYENTSFYHNRLGRDTASFRNWCTRILESNGRSYIGYGRIANVIAESLFSPCKCDDPAALQDMNLLIYASEFPSNARVKLRILLERFVVYALSGWALPGNWYLDGSISNRDWSAITVASPECLAALTLALDAEGRSNSSPNERANRNFGFECYKKDFTGVKSCKWISRSRKFKLNLIWNSKCLVASFLLVSVLWAKAPLLLRYEKHVLSSLILAIRYPARKCTLRHKYSGCRSWGCGFTMISGNSWIRTQL